MFNNLQYSCIHKYTRSILFKNHLNSTLDQNSTVWRMSRRLQREDIFWRGKHVRRIAPCHAAFLVGFAIAVINMVVIWFRCANLLYNKQQRFWFEIFSMSSYLLLLMVLLFLLSTLPVSLHKSAIFFFLFFRSIIFVRT